MKAKLAMYWSKRWYLTSKNEIPFEVLISPAETLEYEGMIAQLRI
jgi:hypothetical protein